MKNSIKLFCLVFITCFYISINIVYLKGPNIKILGNKNIEVLIGTEYIDKGYKATYIDNDLQKDVLVESNVNTEKFGEYEVKYTAFYNDKTYTKIRHVNVVDNKKPSINLTNIDESYVCPGNTYIEDGYEAFDNYDGDITDKVTIEKEEDKWIYTVSDSSNNKISVVRDIKYEDNEEPVIILTGGDYSIYVNSNYEEKGFTASDNCKGNLTDKVKIDGKVNTSKTGEYILIYTVSDGINEVKVERKVTVTNQKEFVNKTVYLTIDDGPTKLTSQYLDILKEEGVKVTFFINDHGRSYDYLIKRMVDEGHVVANHTASHAWSLYSSSSAFWTDVNKLNKIIYNITGIDNKLLRFPGGSSNKKSIAYSKGIMTKLTKEASSKGYIYFDWTIDSNDAGGATTSNEVYNNVVSVMGCNSLNIVLMHDGKNTTLGALRDIIKYGKNMGFTFATIDETTPLAHHHLNN